MNANDILNRIRSNPGSFMRVVIVSPVPTLKSVAGVAIVKRSVVYVTAGTEFQNRKDVKDAIAAGLRGEVQPLPWGAWVDYPFVIGHTPKATGRYTEYVRLYPPSEAQLEHFNLAPSVQFYANGQPITRDEAIGFCGAKAKPDEAKSEAFAVSVDNIESIA